MSTELMSSRERILAACRMQEVDRIPWSPLLDPYFLLGLPQEEKLTDIQAFREAGADAMMRHVLTAEANIHGMFIALAPKPHPEIKVSIKLEVGEVVFDYDTPVGRLKERMRFTPESPFIPWITKYMVETAEDLKILTYLFEKVDVFPSYDLFRFMDKEVGEFGIPTTDGPSTPIQALVNLKAGLERTVFLAHDHPDVFDQFVQTAHEKNLEHCRIVAQSPAEVVIGYENTSSSTTGPRLYEKYEKPLIDEYAGIFHQAGKVFLIHMCGRLAELKDSLATARQDGFTDLSPPPPGNVTPAEAKTWWPDKVITGGIDPISFVNGDRDQLDCLVRETMESLKGKGRGFILGSADATPKGTTIRTLKAITSAVDRYGKIPFSN
jgi:uroporphyrinogen-III decarboxylase